MKIAPLSNAASTPESYVEMWAAKKKKQIRVDQ